MEFYLNFNFEMKLCGLENYKDIITNSSKNINNTTKKYNYLNTFLNQNYLDFEIEESLINKKGKIKNDSNYKYHLYLDGYIENLKYFNYQFKDNDFEESFFMIFRNRNKYIDNDRIDDSEKYLL